MGVKRYSGLAPLKHC